MKRIVLFMSAIALAGCATTNVAPKYVSPTAYQGYDCTTLNSEISRITSTIEKTKQFRPSLSASGIGVGIVGGSGGIYPSISFGVGSGSGARQQKQETLAKLYGEHDAMVVSARQKNCAFAEQIKLFGENKS